MLSMDKGGSIVGSKHKTMAKGTQVAAERQTD